MGNIQLLNKHKAYRNYSAGLGQCNDFCCCKEVELNARGYLHLTVADRSSNYKEKKMTKITNIPLSMS